MNWNELDFNGRTTGQIKINCPDCHSQRRDQLDKSLSVNLDKGVAHCHHCGNDAYKE